MIKVLQMVLGAMLLPLLLAAPVLILVAARSADVPATDRLAMRGTCAIVGLDCGQTEGGLPGSIWLR